MTYIAIDLHFSRNFVSIEYIKRRSNPMVDLWKFTSNKKIPILYLNFVQKINIITYFENLAIGLYFFFKTKFRCKISCSIRLYFYSIK